MKTQGILYATALSILLTAGTAHAADSEQQFGPNPNLPKTTAARCSSGK